MSKVTSETFSIEAHDGVSYLRNLLTDLLNPFLNFLGVTPYIVETSNGFDADETQSGLTGLGKKSLNLFLIIPIALQYAAKLIYPLLVICCGSIGCHVNKILHC